MAEQPAADAHAHGLPISADIQRHGQVEHDVIIIARIERDAFLCPCCDDALDHVERRVAVERSDLDRHHVLDRGEAPPELHRERNAADRGLQIEADQRDFRRNGATVLDQLVDGSAFHRRERKHAGVVAQARRDLRFLPCLRRLARQAGDQHDLALRRLLGRDAQHRLVQPGLANGELRGVDADREAAAAALVAAPAAAQQKIDFILNWVPGGDHAPYYYAKKLGWYQKEGLDVNLEPGKGSALATQKVGAGANPVGLADMGGVLVAKGKGADTVAVFNVYANSPQGMYWLKSSGIKGVKDFPGKKIGNPAADGARTMWPALAKANGIDPKSVTWVNIDANAKLAALKAKTVDITTSFYNLHHVFKRELGDDMGFLAWRDVGLNPYGNSVIVNAEYLKKNRPAEEKFTKVTQRAFAECVQQPKPCVQALIDANGALSFDNELVNWQLVEVLMSDKTSQTVALGWHDDARMKADYELVRDYVGVDKPFDVRTTYTNDFLDKSIKMKPIRAD